MIHLRKNVPPKWTLSTSHRVFQRNRLVAAFRRDEHECPFLIRPLCHAVRRSSRLSRFINVDLSDKRNRGTGRGCPGGSVEALRGPLVNHMGRLEVSQPHASPSFARWALEFALRGRFRRVATSRSSLGLERHIQRKPHQEHNSAAVASSAMSRLRRGRRTDRSSRPLTRSPSTPRRERASRYPLHARRG